MYSPDGNPTAPLKGFSGPGAWKGALGKGSPRTSIPTPRNGTGDADATDPLVHQSTMMMASVEKLASRLLGMLLKAAYWCMNDPLSHKLEI